MSVTAPDLAGGAYNDYPCYPVRIFGESDTYLVPGESLRLDWGSYLVESLGKDGDARIERLDIQPGETLVEVTSPWYRLEARDSEETAHRSSPKRAAVSVERRGPLSQIATRAHLTTRLENRGLRITATRVDSALTVALVTPATPRRSLALPHLAPDEAASIEWLHLKSSTQLRVRAEDPIAELLANLLVTGEYRRAAAAARAAELHEGSTCVLNWSRPAIFQLLIGYAYALGGDYERLRAWNRRTASAQLLGTDGLILAAAASMALDKYAEAAGSLMLCAGRDQPVVSLGGELALEVAERLLDEDGRATSAPTSRAGSGVVTLDGSQDQLLELIDGWTSAQTRADAWSWTLSVPIGRTRAIDVSKARLLTRVAVGASYFVRARGYKNILKQGNREVAVQVQENHHGSRRESESVSPQQYSRDSEPGAFEFRQFRSAAILLVLAVLSAILLQFVEAGSGSLSLAMLGVLLAVPVGLFLGLWMRSEQLARALEEVREARASSRQSVEQAIRGRALAALLQAAGHAKEAPNSVRELAGVSIELFGTLVIAREQAQEVSPGAESAP